MSAKSKVPVSKVPISKDDVTVVGQSAPITATEKLARLNLMKAQIDEANDGSAEGRAHAASLKKAIFAQSEAERIKNDVLIKVSQYSRSTPEWYQLVSVCEGREDPFDQAEFLGNRLYREIELSNAMSMFTPSKNTVREGFEVASAKAVKARTAHAAVTTARLTSKRSVMAEAAAEIGASAARVTASRP